MLFQPPDLLPLDPGYFPVPVHVPKNTMTTAKASVSKRLGINCYLLQTNTVDSITNASANNSITGPCRA